MKSRTTLQFRNQLAKLPEAVQKQAYKQYRLFKQDPRHSSLQFKQIHPRLPIYSARIISKGYRAICKRDAEGVLWFWIGSHAAYDRLLARL